MHEHDRQLNRHQSIYSYHQYHRTNFAVTVITDKLNNEKYISWHLDMDM